MHLKGMSIENIQTQSKRDYVWNTASGLINAMEAVVMSMIVTRITGLADAGMLTMAFAVGNLTMTVGKFGMRNYQVTDVEGEFSFPTYLKARFITVLLMIAAACVYLGYARSLLGYEWNKIGIIFAVCMIYVVEALEDVVWGYYQLRGKLYAGAGMFCFRWNGILLVFPIALCISMDLRVTLLICFGISLMLFFIALRISYPRICSADDRPLCLIIHKNDLGEIGRLLKIVFPLFAISFLAFYENNAPKYAIDACLTDEVQACYGFVAMPVFIIGLLNNFVYQPTLVPMAVEWEQQQTGKFKNRIGRQIIIIGGISVVCILCAYLIGIPVLSLLYSTDLSGYKRELIILLFASIFCAISGYQSVILTIMRCQKSLLWPHCIVSGIAAVSLRHIVSNYGTMGAAFCYLLLMVLLCMLYGAMLVIRLREK